MTDLFGLAPEIKKTAVISDCGAYRYSLTRRWHFPGSLLPFIMLNPSTADAEQDDPTIRRCMGFARREGKAGIVVVNLYAFRSTSPEALWKVEDPIGPDNWRTLVNLGNEAAEEGVPIVCAWGAHARANQVDAIVVALGGCCEVRLVCLGKTAAGAPRHPLYVRADQPLEPFP